MKKSLDQILGQELPLFIHRTGAWKDFPAGFFKWLTLNDHIWREFESKARAMAVLARRQRYSARTIIEVMRWNSDIRQNNKLFKISNNMVPGLARLWMLKYGNEHPKFFQLK